LAKYRCLFNGAVLASNQPPANTQYQWIDCATNTPIQGETNSIYTAVQNGDYAVIVTVGNCSDTSACQNVSGIGLNSNSIDVTIYPNPSNGTVTVEVVTPPKS